MAVSVFERRPFGFLATFPRPLFYFTIGSGKRNCVPSHLRHHRAMDSARQGQRILKRRSEGSFACRAQEPSEISGLVEFKGGFNNGSRVAEVLERAAASFANNTPEVDSTNIYVATAQAKVLGGQRATWVLAWGTGGRFAEKTSTKDLSWLTACSDGAATCWHVDFMGFPMALELEDREAELLSHWILTGQWVQRPARDLLDIRFLEESKEKVVLAVSVTKGRVEARLALCTSTYDPILLEVTTAAGTECWEYQKWKVSRASCSARHPTRIKHRPAAGGEHTYNIKSIGERTLPDAASELMRGMESMSASGMTATDPFDFPLSGDSELTHCASRMAYSTDAQTRVEAVRGEGGHILVSATVNDGALEGLFVLDTGSSGLVLDPHIVAKLNLQSVGQHFSTGIDGGIKAHLCQAECLTLGPVTLKQPIFSTMAMGGAIRGPSDGSKVIGVLGFDFLRGCTVRLESRRRQSGSIKPGRLEVHVYPPGSYTPPPQVHVAWQQMQFVSKVPLVQTGLCIEEMAEDAAPRLQEEPGSSLVDGGLLASRDSALFKLCLGIGGTGCILSSAAANRLRVFHRLLGLQPNGMMTGAGSTQARLKHVDDVVTVRLTWLELQGMRFQAVRAVVHTAGDPTDLELGKYAWGLLAGDLFRGDCTLVLDYPNKRMSVAPAQGGS